MIFTWGRTAALLVAAATLAFGAVYPWAYWPLLVAAGGVGLGALASALVARRGDRRARRLAWLSAIVFVAVAAQLVPVPRALIHAISPATDTFLTEYELGYAAGRSLHPLSIAPPSTLLALAFFAALTVYLSGMTARFGRDDVVSVTRGVAFTGAIISVIGIAQKSTSADRIYGFWTPYGTGEIFGPFVNHNHFAGWIVMAGALTAGHLCSRILRSIDVARGSRRWVDWLSTPLFAEVVFTALALLIMSAALLICGSRSGVGCGALAVAVIVALANQRRSGAAARSIALGALALVAFGAAIWIGPDLVTNRFAEGSWAGGAGRVAPWRDALSVARAFPFAGSGLNTYGLAMLKYQTANPAIHYDAAHNDYLQLAAEGGLLVAVPAYALLAALVLSIAGRLRAAKEDPSARWRRIGAVAGLAAIAAQSAVDFSLQIPANALLCATLAAVALGPAIITKQPRQ